MSKDFPNRSDWLAVRADRNRPRLVRYAHTASTFVAGRNAEKRTAKASPRKRMRMLANRRLRQRQHASMS
jgi:hypothetical protein